MEAAKIRLNRINVIDHKPKPKALLLYVQAAKVNSASKNLANDSNAIPTIKSYFNAPKLPS